MRLNKTIIIEVKMKNNLKQLREAAGLTMQQLGNKSGVSPSQICELEKATGNPTLKTSCSIAHALDTKVWCIWVNRYLF